MASRSIAPIRSLRSAVSRQAAPRVAAARFPGRFYSTEEAEVKESPELVEAKKRAAELEEKVKSLEVSVAFFYLTNVALPSLVWLPSRLSLPCDPR